MACSLGSEETGLVHDVLTYLKLRHIPATRKQSGYIHIGSRWINLGESGWPDIVGFLPPAGRGFAIECKRPGEEPDYGQRDKIRELEAAGVLCIVAHELADVEKILREI